MRRWMVILVVVVVLAVLGGWLWLAGQRAGNVAIPEVGDLSAAALADPALVAQGAYLATAGDCAGCHSVRGGPPYAGGRAIPTPFGTIPGPNLTPDPETGIGGWSFADFWRALHHGQRKDGRWLYPAFPFTSYTKVTPGDARAIFAYLRSLPAVRRETEAAKLSFPYSLRSTLAVWRARYFQPGVFQPDAGQSAAWNRGAYLVQGLGHCNECHAPRNAWGATAGAWLSGGEIPRQDWYAPDLSMQANGGLQGWTKGDVVDLLKTGHASTGAAFGPMADVVADSTQHLGHGDLGAIATYLASLPPRQARPVPRSAFNVKRIAAAGEKVYRQHCADCHGGDGRGVAGVYPPLAGNSAVTEPTGINAVRTVLLGGFPPVTAGNPRPYSMPPYAQQLDDSDVALVVSYIRQSWGNKASIVRPEQVGKYRHTPID